MSEPPPAPREDSLELPYGLRLHVRDWGGDGRPLVLLHGLSSSSRIWDMMAPHLAPDFHVIAYDQRGHGLSDKPDGDYSFREVTADLAALLRELGLERPIIAGHSWGGNVAVQFAAEHPREPAALVLIDGGFTEISSAEGMTWERAEEMMRPPDIDGVPVEDFVRMMKQWPDARANWSEQLQEMILYNFEITPDKRIKRRLPIPKHMQIARAIFDQRPSQLWGQITAPTLLLPTAMPPRNERESAWAASKRRGVATALERLGNGKVVWMEDSIHDVPIQRPQLLADTIREFAEGIA